jgi:hypothetical protein
MWRTGTDQAFRKRAESKAPGKHSTQSNRLNNCNDCINYEDWKAIAYSTDSMD